MDFYTSWLASYSYTSKETDQHARLFQHPIYPDIRLLIIPEHNIYSAIMLNSKDGFFIAERDKALFDRILHISLEVQHFSN